MRCSNRTGLRRFATDKNGTRRLLEAPGEWRNDLKRSATQRMAQMVTAAAARKTNQPQALSLARFGFSPPGD